MFFTKMTLKKGAIRSHGWEYILNAYRRHQLAYRVFCSGEDDTRRFVYRFDLQSKPPTMWVVSEDPPNNEANRLWCVNSKEYNPDLRNGDVLEFKLKANPTHKTSDQKHHSIVTHANKNDREDYESKADLIQEVGEDWLTQCGRYHGFKVLAVRVGSYRRETWAAADNHIATINTLDYNGLLVVEDVDKFQNMLFRGLGRSRSFGCGMMMIKPAASC